MRLMMRPKPTLTSIEPSYGTKNTRVYVNSVAGTGFRAGCTVKLRRPGQPDVWGRTLTVASPTRMAVYSSLTGVRLEIGTW